MLALRCSGIRIISAWCRTWHKSWQRHRLCYYCRTGKRRSICWKTVKLTKQEVNIVETVVAHENECQYCVAGHTAFGKDPLFNNTDEQMNAIRSGENFEDPKLNALRDFTVLVLNNKGRMATSQLQTFLDAGYTRAQALDVVACISAKVMTNYTNQIALTPIDEPFAPLAEGLPYKEERKAVAVENSETVAA